MNKYYYAILILSVFLNSCIQENETLVYPPLIVETVNVRYFNLHNDEMQRTLLLDKKTVSENQAFNTISKPDFPPYDSVTLQVLKEEHKTYSSLQKFKFARQSNYIMIALPDYRQKSDTGTNYEDTIIYIQTTILKPNDTNMCFVKFLNANSDTSINYSIKIGCPNGENLFLDNGVSSVSYLQSTGIQAVYEGKRVISIIKNNKNITDTTTPNKKVVGIFELNLNRLGQYALIVNKYDELFFIDELDANSPLIKLSNVEAKNAYIRIINLSKDNITINSSAQGNLTSNLNNNFIDNYKNITTCDVLNLDKLALNNSVTITDSTYMSFDIYKKYSILAFNTKDKIAGKIVGVPPIDDRVKLKPDKAIIRVVNGNISDYGITISIGARNTDTDVGYESGTTLAVNLLEAEYSKEMYINGGMLPISVFSATQPTKYMFSSIVNVQNNKEYLITIDGLDTGKIAAIEINDESMPIEYGKTGSFLQFVNVCNGNNVLNFSIPNIISNGKLSASNLLTTFIPNGNNSIQASDNSFNFNATIEKRTLLIATSSSNNPDIFAIQSGNMGANDNTLKYRFINASDDTPILQINIDDAANILTTDIAFKTASNINSYTKDRKYSFVFKNQMTGIDLYKANDLLMTLNKNYTIIFYGNKNTGYGIFIVQEY